MYLLVNKILFQLVFVLHRICIECYVIAYKPNNGIYKMKKALSYIIPVALAWAVGLLASRIQAPALEMWYPTLVRSTLTPPDWVFIAGWSLFYTLMGLSLGALVSRGDMSVVRLWLLQLIVNMLWCILFFAMHNPLLGLVDILLLDVLVFTYMVYAYVRRPLAAWLFLPYFIWLLFATYLNGYIYANNSDTTAAAAVAVAAQKSNIKNNSKMTNTITLHTKPALPYAQDALAPTISDETMSYHYGRHLQAYIDNLNKLVANTPYASMPLEEIVVKADGALFNNAAQAWNHIHFFNGMTPHQKPMPKHLEERIKRDFGSVEAFKEKFSAAAASLFGSGWVWLAEKPDGKLEIVSTQNADTPLRKGDMPLLTLDVWEHAYYIDYRNRRADFIKAWWNVVDWDKVAARSKKR